ncbi:PilW family protein [Undibacterium sp. Di26W]|uniref:PilW family protein n=1 Tax=Undibacterium sp. Di26W TaxID=3413035 RepID=UPI003BEF9715
MTRSVMRREDGFSILELMIAMSIGLVMSAAVVSLYVANTQSFKYQDSDARQQETMRAAMDVLGYHIRLAGFVDAVNNPGTRQNLLQPANKDWLSKTDPNRTNSDLLSMYFGQSPEYSSGANKIHGVMGCKGLFTTSGDPLQLSNWTCASATATSPSSLTVAYQVLNSDVGANAGAVLPAAAAIDTMSAYDANTGKGSDCGGNNVNGATASPAGPLAINRFYVDVASKRLMCIGNGDPSKPKAIAEGVEDMYILYGVAPATVSLTVPGDSAVAQYVTADSVADWSRVLSVRVCLQTVATAKNVALKGTNYTDCRGTSVSLADLRYRQITRATFSLRNNILTSPDVLP